MQRRHLGFMIRAALAALLMLGGCTGVVEQGDLDASVTPDLPIIDIAVDSHYFDQHSPDGGDSGLDGSSDDIPDAGVDSIDDVFVDIAEGEPGWPCDQPGDCNSGFCLDTPDGLKCSSLCGGSSSCPRGYTCTTFSTGSDAVSACVHNMPRVCMPCMDDDECKSLQTGHSIACVGDDGGRFCAGGCTTEMECPAGYSCTEATVGSGSKALVCRPADGECGCSDRAILESAATECVLKNEIGTCVGQIVCTEGGLQPCSVQEPTTESCNLKDDDCNGTTDDVAVRACLVQNSFGSCPGTTLCQSGTETCQGQRPEQEQCNEIDDNCNGTTDEENAGGCRSYFEDIDSDTFGNSQKGKCLCGPSGKYTATRGGDCNDQNVEINPDRTESCNGIDDNCNGSTDEENATGCRSYYYDNDADSYGTSAAPKCLCVATRPYSALRTGDCNDSNTNVNPGMVELCNTIDDNCDGATDPVDAGGCQSFYYDFDSDGYGSATVAPKCQCGPDYLTRFKVQVAGDCNDSVVTISPAATEKCDGIDNNCNGTTDENGAINCVNRWMDNDGDGYGTGTSVCSCQAAAPYTAERAGDCNDSDFFINPGISETCDGIDNNCDSKTDDENAGGCDAWFFDGDRDGYGDPTKSRCLCGPSVSTKYDSDNGLDCNDAVTSISPAGTESCGNGKDDDCDGKTDDENADGCDLFYYDSDGDGFGILTIFKCLCAADGLYRTLTPGDCDDNAINSFPGGQETCSAGDEDCDGTFNEQDATGCVTYFYDGDADDYGDPLIAGKCLCAASPSTGFRALVDTDCNDGDSSINPGKTEVCEPDGTPSVDNNCNSFMNEENAIGCKSYYYDFDRDGHGLKNSTPKCYCTGGNVGLRYTSLVADDCNDNDNTVSGGLPELCDGKDNDCDSSTDENGASDCTTYYLDTDRDGYGVLNNSECRCAPDPGRWYDTTAPGDCNDGNNLIYPGQSVCGVDGSCDGTLLDPLEECDDGNSTKWDGCTDCRASEYRINQQTSGDQSWPSSALKSDGGWAVVYSSVRNTTGEDIAVRILSSTGTTQGSEVFANTYTANTQTYPDIAAMASDIVLVWQSDGQDGSGYGIVGRIMNADGTAKYPEFQVNGTSGNAQARPAVAVGSDDRIVTVWQSNLQDGSLEGVYGRIHVAPGAAATSEVLIPQTTALSQTNPDIAIYKAGHRIVVTWTGEVQIDASTTDTRIFARIFDEDLVPVTNEFQVTNSGTTVVGQNNSAVAVTGSVGFVVAFEDYSIDGSERGIRYRAFDWNGNALGAPAIANTFTTGLQAAPSVIGIDDSRFIIAWWSEFGDTDGSAACIARRFVRGGTNGSETILHGVTANYQFYPALAVSSNSLWYAAWMSSQQDGDGRGIYGRTFSF